jgi:hypothetical protein
MSSGINRLRDPKILRVIGRKLLVRFLDSFRVDLATRNTQLPGPDLSDEQYFEAFAAILATPASLPDSLIEAVSAIEAMTDPKAHQALEAAMTDAKFSIAFHPGASPEQIAMQVWLSIPALLAHLETYTLEPLSHDGLQALNPVATPNIERVRLREIEVTSDNSFHHVHMMKSEDLFKNDASNGLAYGLILTHGRITRATFEFQLTGSLEPCAAELRPPHALTVGRLSETQTIKTWLSKRGYIVSTHGDAGSGPEPYGQSVEVA